MMEHATLLPRDVDIERDDSAGAYQLRYDSTDELLSTLVVAAVAEVSDTDPLEFDPLRESVDPDALDDLFGRTPGGCVRAAGSVEFPFADHRVTVEATGEIRIRPAKAATEKKR